MLRKNKVLTSLGLYNCGISPKGLNEVCNALGENTTLTSLDLSWNKFDDQSITSLGKLLIIICSLYWVFYIFFITTFDNILLYFIS